MKKILKVIVIVIAMGLITQWNQVSLANNHTDRYFEFTFSSDEAQRTVKFPSTWALTKRDRSGCYVKNSGNRFYLVDIRQDNGTRDGIMKSKWHHYRLNKGQANIFSNYVELGTRALPRLEKGPGGVRWKVWGYFSPDNYDRIPGI